MPENEGGGGYRSPEEERAAKELAERSQDESSDSASGPESTVEAEVQGASAEELGVLYLSGADTAETPSPAELDANAKNFFSKTKLNLWLKGIGSALGAAAAGGLAVGSAVGMKEVMDFTLQNAPLDSDIGLKVLAAIAAFSFGLAGGGVLSGLGVSKALESRRKSKSLGGLKDIRETLGDETYQNAKRNEGF